jgi:S1-C subfamily serine protease/peptidoglycan hydrolase-like protein with peptidoglycan-binding domain
MIRLPLASMIVSLTLISQSARAQDDTFADIPYFFAALNIALEQGLEVPWQNPSTGHHGTIEFIESVSRGANPCSTFTRSWITGEAESIYEGTACREPNGVWKITDERQTSLLPASDLAPAEGGSTVLIAPTYDETTAAVQRQLTALGFDPGPIDGVAGPRTTAAIQEFQRQNDLTPDGQVSPALSATLGQAVPASYSLENGVAQSSADQQTLIDALDELQWVISDKIDSDVEMIARAFADAYDIQQSRKVADYVMLPLVFVKEAFSLYSTVMNWQEIAARIDQAGTVLELSSLVTGLAHLKEVSDNVQLAWDGPPYGSLVEAMLKEASTSSIAGEYPTIIKLHLAGVGDRKSPIWARHRVGETYELYWGIHNIKQAIASQMSAIREEISKNSPSNAAAFKAILAKLAEISRVIKQSRLGNGAAPVTAFSSGSTELDLQLGSVGALEQLRIQALGQYDSDLAYEQSVVITAAVKLGAQYVRLSVGYKSPTGQTLGQIQRDVFVPVSLLGTTLRKVYPTSAREQINGLPYEMLLALSPELTNLWMILDDIISYLRSEFSPMMAEQNAVSPNSVESVIPALGVTVAELSTELRNRYSIAQKTKGMVVVDIVPNGSAAAKGLIGGDVIIEIDQRPVSTGKELESALSYATNMGYRVVTLLILRKESLIYAALQIDGRPIPTERQVTASNESGELAPSSANTLVSALPGEVAVPELGIVIAPLTNALRSKYRLPPDAYGTLIVGVESTGPASNKGLREGDLIQACEGKTARDPTVITNGVESAKKNGLKSVLLTVYRGGDFQLVAIRMADITRQQSDSFEAEPTPQQPTSTGDTQLDSNSGHKTDIRGVRIGLTLDEVKALHHGDCELFEDAGRLRACPESS